MFYPLFDAYLYSAIYYIDVILFSLELFWIVLYNKNAHSSDVVGAASSLTGVITKGTYSIPDICKKTRGL